MLQQVFTLRAFVYGSKPVKLGRLNVCCCVEFSYRSEYLRRLSISLYHVMSLSHVQFILEHGGKKLCKDGSSTTLLLQVYCFNLTCVYVLSSRSRHHLVMKSRGKMEKCTSYSSLGCDWSVAKKQQVKARSVTFTHLCNSSFSVFCTEMQKNT